MDGGDCRTAPATPGLLNSVVINIVIESMHGATSMTEPESAQLKGMVNLIFKSNLKAVF